SAVSEPSVDRTAGEGAGVHRGAGSTGEPARRADICDHLGEPGKFTVQPGALSYPRRGCGPVRTAVTGADIVSPRDIWDPALWPHTEFGRVYHQGDGRSKRTSRTAHAGELRGHVFHAGGDPVVPGTGFRGRHGGIEHAGAAPGHTH